MKICVSVLLALILSGFSDARIEAQPRLSIITSVWNGDEFIEGFLEDITQQTIFSESELIMINANSPGHEEETIRKYMELYPNIIYVSLDKDPGLYGVWNRGIKMASSEFIANANLDDRSSYDALELHVKELEGDPSLDLVYGGYFITEHPNETFYNNQHIYWVDPPEFTQQNMMKCLPGPRPVWRKSLHDRYGYFDETFCMSADWGMWLRAVDLGARFKKLDGFYTLYYKNPKGLSTDPDAKRSQQRHLEDQLIVLRYSHLWEPVDQGYRYPQACEAP